MANISVKKNKCKYIKSPIITTPGSKCLNEKVALKFLLNSDNNKNIFLLIFYKIT